MKGKVKNTDTDKERKRNIWRNKRSSLVCRLFNDAVSTEVVEYRWFVR